MLKNSGEAPTHGQIGWFWPAGVGRSSRSKLLRWPLSLGGRLSASAAASTPGTAASRSNARFQKAARFASVAYAAPVNETDAVRMRSVSTPTGTRFRRSRLVSTSTAATSSGVASANSAATRARRTCFAAGPSVAERPPARSVSSTRMRDPYIAGTSPIRMALAIVRMTNEASAGPTKPISATRGM